MNYTILKYIILLSILFFAKNGNTQMDCTEYVQANLSFRNLEDIDNCLQNLGHNDSIHINFTKYKNILIQYSASHTNLSKGEAVLLTNIYRQLGLTAKKLNNHEEYEQMNNAGYLILLKYFPIQQHEIIKKLSHYEIVESSTSVDQKEDIDNLVFIDSTGLEQNQIKEILYSYYSCFLAKGDLRYAHIALCKYLNEQQKFAAKETDQKIAELNLSYKIQQDKLAITQKSKLRLHTLTKSLIILLIGGVILISIFGAFYFQAEFSKSQQEANSVQLEQQLLSIQMNPHFIFNAITAIHAQILMDQKELASKYLDKFSNLIHNILESTSNKFITLDSEIKTLNEYVALQQFRFYDKFDYQLIMDDTLNPSDIYIPSMIIQPFVENAIEHGIRDIKEKGLITIKLSYDNRLLKCEILDNGKGYTPEVKNINPTKKSLSLTITKERIASLNKELKSNGTLTISKREDRNGTRVQINIPTNRKHD